MKAPTLIVLLLVAAGVGAYGGIKYAANRPNLDSPLKWQDASNVERAAGPAGAPDFRPAAKQIMPSVVSVDRLERIQDFWTEEVSVTPTGGGSGVIVSPDGYILTNNHVVEGADIVQVRLLDHRRFQAKVVGADPRSDVAVLKIDAPNLKPAELGSSAKLEVGEWVLAVGNPLGYENTVSAGVVSSLKRTLATGQQSLLIDTIQTDAAINQGNSGGALTDSQGRLVGINSAIASPTGGSIGIGFAIPIDRARRVADDIVKFGRAKYGSLGIDVFTRPGLLANPGVRKEIAERVGAEPPQTGVIVRRVIAGGSGRTAGIEPLDIIISIDGKPMTDSVNYAVALADKRPGDKITVRFWSKGKEKTTTVELQDQ